MGNRLFVGNLPFKTTETDVRDLVAADGRKVVSVKLVTDRDTGESRGFAFVDMESDAEAQATITALDGKDFGGRPLKVNVAQEKGAGGKGVSGPGGGGFRGGHDVDRGARGGFGSRGPSQSMPRGSTRGGGRGGSRGS